MNFFRNLFKKQKQKTYYYEDLLPEERIYLTLKDHLFPKFGAYGFKMTRNPLRMMRTTGAFVHSIHFLKNKWNRTGEMASFCPYVMVTVPGYAKWHLKTYGTKAEGEDDCVMSEEPRFLPGWSPSLKREFFDLAQEDNDELIHALTAGFKSCVLPCLEQYVEIDPVLEILGKRAAQGYPVFSYMFDLCLIKSDMQGAKAVLRRFEENPPENGWLQRKMSDRKAWLESQTD